MNFTDNIYLTALELGSILGFITASLMAYSQYPRIACYVTGLYSLGLLMLKNNIQMNLVKGGNEQ